MQQKRVRFNNATVNFYFDASFKELQHQFDKSKTFILTDEHVFAAHAAKFRGYEVIVIPAGEQHKTYTTVQLIIEQLIQLKANRHSLLIGIGGGGITDITGFVAGIFMRGIQFGFVPTTILAMVDAAIGGKNGVDVGVYKNMIGLIRQPSFIIYDYSFLNSLPADEWSNGFAEIIKHGCIKSISIFQQLQENTLAVYKKNKELLNKLILQNVLLKCKIVQADEFENGERKLLNFGHSIAHAVENNYSISHGQAVAIGIVADCIISKELKGFKQAKEVVSIIDKYKLPAMMEFDANIVIETMKADKKGINKQAIDYILLNKIGKAVIEPLSFQQILSLLQKIQE